MQRPITGLVVHRARVLEGEVATGRAPRPWSTSRAGARSRAPTLRPTWCTRPCATSLGDGLYRSGNSPGRFRFDFEDPAVPAAAMAEIEARINVLLLDDLPVTRTSWRRSPRAGWARWRSSARSTASSVVLDRRLVARAVRRHHAPRLVGQIGVAASSARHPSARAFAVQALVGADARRSSAREAAIVTWPLDRRRARAARRAARPASRACSPAQGRRAGDRRGQAGPGARCRTRSRPRARVTSAVSPSSDTTGPTSAPRTRALVLDVRSRLGGDRPVVVSMAAVAGGRPFAIVATNERARGEGIGRRLRPRRGSGAAAVAARTTSPRAGSDLSAPRRARRGRERASHPGRMSPDGERPTHVARHVARVGADVGNARVGVAASDPSGSSRTQCAPWGGRRDRRRPARDRRPHLGDRSRRGRRRPARPPGEEGEADLARPMPSGWPS